MLIDAHGDMIVRCVSRLPAVSGEGAQCRRHQKQCFLFMQLKTLGRSSLQAWLHEILNAAGFLSGSAALTGVRPVYSHPLAV